MADQRGAAGGRLGGVVVVAILLVLTALSILAVQPPRPRSSDAPAADFSAGRAFAHLERLGGTPHPTGSPANDQVRAYLVSTLTRLGLQPEVQDAESDRESTATRVRNVVATLPGTASTGQVFLVAHYDSVPDGPGANDDGSGVSAILEAARALTAGPRLRNDVVIVLTDAEEKCLCGADAFAQHHPLSAAGGVVLNFESRGSTGVPIMFETSTGNARLVGVFAGAVPRPIGTSFAVEVYRILPNDTDFTAFMDTGNFTGLNTAYIDGSYTYHTGEDTPEHVDQGTLQAQGEDALGLARAFGAADLPALARPGEFDATYFPVLGQLVRYPGWLVLPLAVLALLGVIAFGELARRRGHTSWGRCLAGFALTSVPLLLAPLAARALWAIVVAIHPAYSGVLDPVHPAPYRLAVLVLTGIIVLAWWALLRRRVGPLALVVGALGWLALLGVAFAVWAPGGSYLVTLPALAAGAAGMTWLALPAGVLRLVATGVAGAVAALVLVPTIVLFFPALGLAQAYASALFIALLGLALLPVVELLAPSADQPTSLQATAARPT